MAPSVMPTSRQDDGHPSPTAVSAVGLRKSYGEKLVLDGIDLRIPGGSVFALLGPNGAGKTTAVKILSTLITADAGDLHVGGRTTWPPTRRRYVPRSVSPGSSPPWTV
ncbi:ATP-binding cassette domain-containing protein [Streptomyces sp. NPDC058620]|uniref:ATP-binding cassette domain-containing protein n=1 Tax=Streptomyces sp. NPDC058620 TaxID=3346560 RepID=UPI003659DD71